MSAGNSPNLELRRFAVDNLLVFSRIIGLSLLGVISTALLARVLGTGGNGQFELVSLLTSLLAGTLLNFGIPIAAGYYTASRQYDLKTILSTAMAILCILIPVMMLVGAGIILLGGESLLNGVSPELLYLGLLVIPFFMMQQVLRNVIVGLQDFRALGLVDLMQPAITLVILLVLGLSGEITIAGATLSLAAGYLITNIASLLMLRARLESWRDMLPRFNRRFTRDLLVYGLKIYGNIIISTLLLRIDMILVADLGGGTDSVGIYAVAVNIGERIWTLSGFTSTVLMPRIASWQDEDHRRNQLTLLTAKYTLWVSIIAGVAMVLLGRWAINLIFTAQFNTAFDAMLALLPGIMAYNLARIFSSDVIGRGRSGLVIPSVLAALVVNVLLNFVLIPRYDFIGASLASSIAYTVFAIGAIGVFFRLSKARWQDLILPNEADVRRFRSLFNLMRSYTQKAFLRG